MNQSSLSAGLRDQLVAEFHNIPYKCEIGLVKFAESDNKPVLIKKAPSYTSSAKLKKKLMPRPHDLRNVNINNKGNKDGRERKSVS